MNKVKTGLLILSIALMVTPILVELTLYKDNLEGLIIPSELGNLINSNNNINDSGQGNAIHGNENSNNNLDFSFSDLQPPQLVGQPQFNPIDNTVSFTFKMTDPVDQPVSIQEFNAGIVSHDDGKFLGNITIDKPITLEPGQTVDITTLGALSPEAINYLKTYAQNQEPLNIDLTNITVNVGGVDIKLDKQNIGDITIPQGALG